MRAREGRRGFALLAAVRTICLVRLRPRPSTSRRPRATTPHRRLATRSLGARVRLAPPAPSRAAVVIGCWPHDVGERKRSPGHCARCRADPGQGPGALRRWRAPRGGSCALERTAVGVHHVTRTGARARGAGAGRLELPSLTLVQIARLFLGPRAHRRAWTRLGASQGRAASPRGWRTRRASPQGVRAPRRAPRPTGIGAPGEPFRPPARPARLAQPLRGRRARSASREPS
jgi:hypothetical protein